MRNLIKFIPAFKLVDEDELIKELYVLECDEQGARFDLISFELSINGIKGIKPIKTDISGEESIIIIKPNDNNPSRIVPYFLDSNVKSTAQEIDNQLEENPNMILPCGEEITDVSSKRKILNSYVTISQIKQYGLAKILASIMYAYRIPDEYFELDD